ncbi:hypothetical protein [Pseudogemmobacter bohemicus]|uniref:hypothetical protein n=1 Tax=Pseudogemmobacter bohemicus TaxID=2250708 RepID=UPI001E5F75FD|nr:hypothetical protein [Pseudogemmobacter bohemicus]
MLRLTTLALIAGLLSGCVATTGAEPSLPPLSEEVLALVGPNQDLASARLVPEDGCYWYEHTGPVETTLIPLLSQRGRPICVQKS